MDVPAEIKLVRECSEVVKDLRSSGCPTSAYLEGFSQDSMRHTVPEKLYRKQRFDLRCRSPSLEAVSSVCTSTWPGYRRESCDLLPIASGRHGKS